MSTIFAFVAGYFVILFGLTLLARPHKVRLVQIADSLLDEEGLRHEYRYVIQKIVETSGSMRTAPIYLLAMIRALLTPSLRFDKDANEWAKDNADVLNDKRWRDLFREHMAIAAAANPIFGALMYAARALFHLKAYLFVRRYYHSNKPALDPKALEIFGELKTI